MVSTKTNIWQTSFKTISIQSLIYDNQTPSVKQNLFFWTAAAKEKKDQKVVARSSLKELLSFRAICWFLAVGTATASTHSSSSSSSCLKKQFSSCLRCCCSSGSGVVACVRAFSVREVVSSVWKSGNDFVFLDGADFPRKKGKNYMWNIIFVGKKIKTTALSLVSKGSVGMRCPTHINNVHVWR